MTPKKSFKTELPRLVATLAAMEERVGRARVLEALEKAVAARPKDRAARALLEKLLAGLPLPGTMESVRALFAEGAIGKGVDELTAVLNARPPAPPSTLSGSVQAVLIRMGWVMRARTAPGAVHFEVRRAGERGALGEVVLEFREGSERGSVMSLVPVFRLSRKVRTGPEGVVSLLKPGEKKGFSELSSGLCLLLESPRGHAEAGEVMAHTETHEGQSGCDLLLRTIFACNQKCLFCFVPMTGRRVDSAGIERELTSLSKRLSPGEPLTISGGEPLVDKRLPEILKSARRKGIRRFVLQTNAVGLAPAGAIEKLIGLGVTTYFVSFHAHKRELYDRLTGSRGLYPRAVKGLTRLLESARCQATVNVVVNALNYRELPELMGFLGGLARACGRGKSSPLGIFFSTMSGANLDKLAFLAVSLEEVSPYLDRAVKRCVKEGLEVQAFASETAFPPCLVSDPGSVVSPRDLPQDRMRYVTEISGEAGAIGRAKSIACKKCLYDLRCLGVPAGYARDHGLGALKVIK